MSTNGVTEIQRGGIDQRLVKAISHPHRLHALKILNERTASPIQLAPIVGTTVGRIAYHVRELERLDCIELVETRPVRGATEHFYRATARAFFSADEWVQLPETIRTSISGMMITEMWGWWRGDDRRHVRRTRRPPSFLDPDGRRRRGLGRTARHPRPRSGGSDRGASGERFPDRQIRRSGHAWRLR